MRKQMYRELKDNPPILKIEGKPREIKIDLVSVMCDNKYRWIVKKDGNGDYRINTSPFAYSNFQIEWRKDDIEWEMDKMNWNEVFDMINSGTSVIANIKYR
tara:strand:+ start:2713 stop:3015 length:303 start_codon:yes stop_codon:yes gene_type:complete